MHMYMYISQKEADMALDWLRCKKPRLGSPKLRHGVPKRCIGVPKPRLGDLKPMLWVPNPRLEVPKPRLGFPKPRLVAPQSRLGVSKPWLAYACIYIYVHICGSRRLNRTFILTT